MPAHHSDDVVVLELRNSPLLNQSLARRVKVLR